MSTMVSPIKINAFRKLLGNPTTPKTSTVKFVNGVLQNEAAAIANTNTQVSKEDILQLQANVNLQLQNQNEFLKSEIKAMADKLLPTQKLEDMLTKFNETWSENSANLWKHCLEDRETINSQEKKLTTLQKDLNRKTQAVESKCSNLTQSFNVEIGDVKSEILKLTMDEAANALVVGDVQKRMQDAENCLNQIPSNTLLIGDVQTQLDALQTTIDGLSSRMAAVEGSKKNNQMYNFSSPVKERIELNYATNELSSPHLLLMDSNGMKVDVKRLSRDPNFTCEKVFTPAWKDIKNYVEQVVCENTEMVEKIFIHVGTNDFDSNDSIVITSLIEEGINALKDKFKQAEITMCSIIPRKHDTYKNEIKLVNDFILGSRKRLKVTVIDLGSIIKQFMFYDEKHVNPTGLHNLINAVKFAILGLFPSFDQGKDVSSYGGRGRGRGRGRGQSRGPGRGFYKN